MTNKKRTKKFNISNKLAYTLIAILSIILIGVGVYAYGGIVPTAIGHSMGELMPSCTGFVTGTSGVANSWSCISTPLTCTGTGQALQYNSTTKVWTCVTLSVITSPACAICYTCGGAWPNVVGSFSDIPNGYSGYSTNCAGARVPLPGLVYLCCK